MARQSNEDRAVSAKPSKGGLNPGVESTGGGKAVPVNEQVWQLELPWVQIPGCTRIEAASRPVFVGGGAARVGMRRPRRRG
jgi:hypothetical protein